MAIFCLWNKCNNNCIMCTNPPDFHSDENSEKYSYDKVLNRLRARKDKIQENNEVINLTGGEPTIHPHFLDFLTTVREEFPTTKIVIATNGRRFYYSDFAKKVLSVSSLNLEVAIHGRNASIHDAITRTRGSFKQTIQGIRNINKYRNPAHQELEIRTILIKQNYKDIEKTLSFIASNFQEAERMIVIFPEVEGIAGENLDLIGVTYEEVRPYVEKAAKKRKTVFKDFRLYHFPLCMLDHKLWDLTWRTVVLDEVGYMDKCDNCLYKDFCFGVHYDYMERVGTKEFSPVKKDYDIEVDSDHFHHPIVKS